MRIFLCAALAATVLVGCQTRDERQTAQCLNYGFPAGTQQFAQCKMTLDMNERQALQQQQLQDQAIQAQQQQQSLQPLTGSLLGGPRATSCGWNAGQWVCRPSY